jgi:hypothetical protein
MARPPKKTPAGLERALSLAHATEKLLDVLTSLRPGDVDLAMAHRCMQSAADTIGRDYSEAVKATKTKRTVHKAESATKTESEALPSTSVS